MDALFIKLLNMSIAAGWLVIAAALLRGVLKGAPKAMRCLLWALVGIRLVCPFSFESALSLIPSAHTVSPDIIYSETPAIQSGINALNSAFNPAIAEAFTPEAGNSVNPLGVIVSAASVIWLAGVAIMAVYAAVSYITLHRRVAEAVPLSGNIFRCACVSSPFVLGLIRPRIYLPFGMDEENAAHVIAHERAHIARRDNWIKPFGFLLLSVYWFNPLIWLAYILLCRDIELACDEHVVRDMGPDAKKAYSVTLLECSVPHRTVAACPLAFGETDVKERIKSVLSYKKPALWIIIAAVVVCAVAAVCFLTNPKDTPSADENAVRSDVPADRAPILTLEEVIALSQKGDALSWTDFSGYTFIETGSGLYIRVYEIDETFSLWMGGPAPSEAPWYIRLISNEDPDDYIDIRTEDAAAFIRERGHTASVSGVGGADESQQAAEEAADALDAAVSAAILAHYGDWTIPHEKAFICASHVTLANEASGPAAGERIDTATVYAAVLWQAYTAEGDSFTTVAGANVPAAITFDVDENGAYTLKEYWEPRDGAYYADDIRERFPVGAVDAALGDIGISAWQSCYAQAVGHFSVDTDAVVGRLFDVIMSSPATSSNPGDYIAAHPIEERELLRYGAYTLDYIAKEPQTGLKGHLMQMIKAELDSIT